MMINFSEKWTSRFFVSPVLLKGTLSFYLNGSDETVEVNLRTVIFVNQLSVYGAVADMCGELAWEVSRSSKGTGKPGAAENLETMLMPPEVSTTNQTSQTEASVQGNLLRDRSSQIFQSTSIDQTLFQCWSREDC